MMESTAFTAKLWAYFPGLNIGVVSLLSMFGFLLLLLLWVHLIWIFHTLHCFSLPPITLCIRYWDWFEEDYENTFFTKKTILSMENIGAISFAKRCTTAKKAEFIIRALVLKDMFGCRKESRHLRWLSRYMLVLGINTSKCIFEDF